MVRKKRPADDAAKSGRQVRKGTGEEAGQARRSRETHHLLRELQARQEELEIKNEELRKAWEELEISQARYFDLYNRAPVGYITLDDKGMIDEVNLTAAILLGVSKEALLRRSFSLFIHPDYHDAYYRHRCRLFETGLSQECQLCLIREDKSVFWGHLVTRTDQKMADKQYCRIVISDISMQKQGEEKLRVSACENELLLKEVHHRVKNNLQLLSSLLGMQSRYVNAENVYRVLKECQDRIRIIACVHTQLYKSRNFAGINFGDYIRETAGQLLRLYEKERTVSLCIHSAGIVIPLDIAIPCGLIINEFVTNSLKHAFPGERRGIITIELKEAEKGLCLNYSDDGIGFPRGRDFRQGETMGLSLISLLVEQMAGAIERTESEGTGYRVTLRFQ